MRQWAAILGALLMFTLTGCAREEPGQRLTAVGIDTCTGVVTDYFTRGDGEAFADCIEVDTGDGGPLLFTLPEAGTPGVDAEVGIGDTIRLESDGGDEAYRLVRSLEVTEARSVQKEPPALTVSVGEKTRAEAGKGSSSWSYSDGRGGGCSIESCAASPCCGRRSRPCLCPPPSCPTTPPSGSTCNSTVRRTAWRRPTGAETAGDSPTRRASASPPSSTKHPAASTLSCRTSTASTKSTPVGTKAPRAGAAQPGTPSAQSCRHIIPKTLQIAGNIKYPAIKAGTGLRPNSRSPVSISIFPTTLQVYPTAAAPCGSAGPPPPGRSCRWP